MSRGPPSARWSVGSIAQRVPRTPLYISLSFGHNLVMSYLSLIHLRTVMQEPGHRGQAAGCSTSHQVHRLKSSGSRTKTSQNVHSALPAQVDPCRGRRSARSTPASIRQHTAHDAVCCRPLRPLGVPRASKLQGDSVGGAARRRRQSITTIGLRGRIDVLSARNAFPQ